MYVRFTFIGLRHGRYTELLLFFYIQEFNIFFKILFNKTYCLKEFVDFSVKLHEIGEQLDTLQTENEKLKSLFSDEKETNIAETRVIREQLNKLQEDNYNLNSLISDEKDTINVILKKIGERLTIVEQRPPCIVVDGEPPPQYFGSKKQTKVQRFSF